MNCKTKPQIARLLACLVLLAAWSLPETLNAAAAQRRFVTLASGWVVGVYYPMAGAISRIVYNADLGIRLTVESSGASAANATLIGSGDADLAILQNDIAFYAHQGSTLARFENKPVRNLRGVLGLHREPVQLVARADSGIKSVADLKGKRVAVGPLGSGTDANALQFLEAYGLKFADLARVDRIAAAEAADFLKDGRIDAGFFTVGAGAAVIQDIAVITPITIVPMPEDKLALLSKRYPFYVRETIPKGAYPGLEAPATTAAVRAILAASADLEEDLVYRILKAIFDDLPTFYSAHAAAKQVTLKNAREGLPVPLHPGAERFYKEAGVR